MKIKTEKIIGFIGVVTIFLLVTTLSSGIASAAQTSTALTVTGNSFTDIDYSMNTQSGLPYEKDGYSINMFIVDGEDARFEHSLDVGDGVEAETVVAAKGNDPRTLVWIDEYVARRVIGDTQVSENTSAVQCYSAGAGYSAAARDLDYESAVIVTSDSIVYAVEAAGDGRMRWENEEYVASGDVANVDNSTSITWMDSYESEDIRANGAFTFAGSYYSEISGYPAAFEEDEEAEGRLCPFKWGE